MVTPPPSSDSWIPPLLLGDMTEWYLNRGGWSAYWNMTEWYLNRGGWSAFWDMTEWYLNRGGWSASWDMTEWYLDRGGSAIEVVMRTGSLHIPK